MKNIRLQSYARTACSGSSGLQLEFRGLSAGDGIQLASIQDTTGAPSIQVSVDSTVIRGVTTSSTGTSLVSSVPIQNSKINLKSIAAGSGIVITESNDILTISSSVDVSGVGSKWYVGPLDPVNIPDSSNNDMYLNTTTGDVFQLENASWTAHGNIMGPQGEQGPSGDVGPQGPQGPAGATGPQGPQGPMGLKGDMGERGIIGPVGAQGPAGLTGPKGDTGETGPQGPAGVQGPKGDTGDSGPIGAQGPKGDTGATGPQGNPGVEGPQGPAGSTGATGAQGPAGPTGPQGEQGETGAQGPKGDTGATGPQGPKGDTGAQGPQGPKGDTGATGATGPQGPQGATGATPTIDINSLISKTPGNLITNNNGLYYGVSTPPDLKIQYVDSVNGVDHSGSSSMDNPQKTIGSAINQLPSGVQDAIIMLRCGQDHYIMGSKQNAPYPYRGTTDIAYKGITFDGYAKVYSDDPLRYMIKNIDTADYGFDTDSLTLVNELPDLVPNRPRLLATGARLNPNASTGAYTIREIEGFSATEATMTFKYVELGLATGPEWDESSWGSNTGPFDTGLITSRGNVTVYMGANSKVGLLRPVTNNYGFMYVLWGPNLTVSMSIADTFDPGSFMALGNFIASFSIDTRSYAVTTKFVYQGTSYTGSSPARLPKSTYANSAFYRDLVMQKAAPYVSGGPAIIITKNLNTTIFD